MKYIYLSKGLGQIYSLIKLSLFIFYLLNGNIEKNSIGLIKFTSTEEENEEEKFKAR